MEDRAYIIERVSEMSEEEVLLLINLAAKEPALQSFVERLSRSLTSG